MRALLIASVLALVPLTGTARARESARLAIGLVRTFGQASHILLSSDTAFVVTSASGQVVERAAPGTVLEAVAGDEGLVLSRMPIDRTDPCELTADPVTIQPDAAGVVRVARIDAAADRTHPRWHRYRGQMTLRSADDGTLRLIDTIELEEYLYGVVPPEIGAGSPVEALKAQAVAARTYALNARGKLAAEGYDLDDTTRCQSYAGADGEAASATAAVEATRGEVLTYAGTLIDAPYSTDCGGVTAVGTAPYLQAVRDAPDDGGPDYCATSRGHTWTLQLTAGEMERLLARDARTRVDGFAGLTVDALDASGRIMSATVNGKDGAHKTITGPQIRAILGVDRLRSTRAVLSRTPSGDYLFKGSGWGHGLGMCQAGAIAMAGTLYRKTYREILAHYYPGTQIVKQGP